MDNSEIEEYRDVVGFGEYFQVSNLGNIYSKRSKRLLKLAKSPNGYWIFSTRIDGTNHTFKVHRLVAEAFIPNPESKPLVNHIDGCKTNNMLSNLEWVTASENNSHAWATGLRKHSQRKLTDDQVREIRASTKTNRELASIYGLSNVNIGRIKRRESYKDIPDSPPSLSGGYPLSNLEWVTPTENVAHAITTGLRNRKLTADQVREIRASNLSQIKLGEIYGIDQANVSRIKRRETYKDVPDSQPEPYSGVMQSFPDAQNGV